MMTREIDTLDTALDDIEAVIFDQWGVLHNGSAPYPFVANCLRRLARNGMRLGVLSNSGKRAALNADRIASYGCPTDVFECIMTSGEALWQDVSSNMVPNRAFHAITGASGDAEIWAKGLDISLVSIGDADAILLMGLPEDASLQTYNSLMSTALARGLPMYCSNPDRASPRAGIQTVLSPGALAHHYAMQGGKVLFYGKPHPPVFHALEKVLGLPSHKILMVGDSLEHDIAGAKSVGWRSAFIQSGLHADVFQIGSARNTLVKLAALHSSPLPDFTLKLLR